MVLGLLAAADVAARLYAQDQLASRAKASSGAQSASASISSFPFLYHLVAQGRVDKVTVSLRGVQLGRLDVDRIQVTARQVHLERSALVKHRKLVVTSIASATATLSVTPTELSAAIGEPVSIEGGSLLVSPGGHPGLALRASIAGGHLLALEVAGREVGSFELSGNPILPACQMGLSLLASKLVVSCTMAPVPASLIAALSASA